MSHFLKNNFVSNFKACKDDLIKIKPWSDLIMREYVEQKLYFENEQNVSF